MARENTFTKYKILLDKASDARRMHLRMSSDERKVLSQNDGVTRAYYAGVLTFSEVVRIRKLGNHKLGVCDVENDNK